MELFRYQYDNNEIYNQYCHAVHRPASSVNDLVDIPFLPISFFKTHRVLTGNWQVEPPLLFESSGTTGELTSKHLVYNKTLYEASLLKGFSDAFGPPSDYTFLALLPSYLERSNASLVHMARILISQNASGEGGFYLHEWQQLHERLLALKATGRKVVLLGVTFALIDFATAFPSDLSGIVVMETGGMKGRREEWTRNQVHDFLKSQWNVESVATEYGMTELLSQAYARKEGILTPSSTMRVLVRDITDPLSTSSHGNGALNIIDLANVYSCAFVATEDIGTVYDTGSFEVMGRMDHAVLRGCSLMAV